MTARQSGLKRGPASLIGGIAVGFAVLVLWCAIARNLDRLSFVSVITGAILAAAVAVWIRIADL